MDDVVAEAYPPTLSNPEKLLSLYYQDLRKIAARILHQDAASVLLQPTELANEAAMRLMKIERMDWQSVTHFLATAARVMRQALLDEVRRARSQKRSAPPLLTMWPDAEPTDFGIDLEALDLSITELESISPERARVVELRLFAGLSIEEIAVVQGVSARTIKRQWQVARIWLTDQLSRR